MSSTSTTKASTTKASMPALVEIISETRVFPSRPLGHFKTTPLSIVDATVLRYSFTTGLWFFDGAFDHFGSQLQDQEQSQSQSQSQPQGESQSQDQDESFIELTTKLKDSLTRTLDWFPHFAGLLHFVDSEFEDNDEADEVKSKRSRHCHTDRYKRVVVSYGEGGSGSGSGSDLTEGKAEVGMRAKKNTSDPGVRFVVAKFKGVKLSDIIPDAKSRREGSRGNGCWDGTHIPVDQLIPARNSFSLGNFEVDDRRQRKPCLAVQITSFVCGGVVVAVRSSHAVADSITLGGFVNCWAWVHRHPGVELEEDMKPDFDPSLVDEMASGDIDAREPDQRVMEVARGMPVHRFDSWCLPGPNGEVNSVPKDFEGKGIKLGTPPPEGGSGGEMACFTIWFGRKEIENIWRVANAGEKKEGVRISRHDALNAHIWILINRARGFSQDSSSSSLSSPKEEDYNVHLNFTIGLRTRRTPPLPQAFVGSPTLIADISLPSKNATDPSTDLPLVASKIRETIKRFTEEGIGALLHEKAFDESPHRYLHSAVGGGHLIQTSWLRCGMWDVDFGFGGENDGKGRKGKLRYAMGALVLLDGFVQSIESAPLEEGEEEFTCEGDDANKESGIDIVVRIAKETIEKVVKDPLLRMYRD